MSRIHALAATLLLVGSFAHARGILMIGDSLSVGAQSDKILKLVADEIGGHVRIIASGGSKPEDWVSTYPVYQNKWGFTDYSDTQRISQGHAKSHRNPYQNPKLRDLLRTEKPEILVIQQGTNLMGFVQSGKNLSVVSEQVRALVREAFSTSPRIKKCLWVAPPDTSLYSKDTEEITFHLIARAVAGRCRVLDSRDTRRVGVYPAAPNSIWGDGIHLAKARGGKAVQRNWARAIVDEIKEL